MEFNLNKILKALLFSTAEPLTVRDIQRVITRFHEEAEKCQMEFKELSGDAAEGGVIAEDSAEGGEGEFVEEDAVDGSGVAESESMSSEESVEFAESSNAVHGDRMYSAQYISQVPSLLTAAQIREAIDQIDLELQESGDVYRVQTTASGFRVVIVPELSEWVRLMRNAPKPTKLRASSLETLAIIAYRQPATRAQMEAIRGVAVDNALNKLIELELITVVGRADAPGRPIQYGTTNKFLEFCGITSLSDLPASDVLSPSQLNDLITKATNASTPQDGDVGLASPEDDVEGELVCVVGEEESDGRIEAVDFDSEDEGDAASITSWDENGEGDEDEESENGDDDDNDEDEEEGDDDDDWDGESDDDEDEEDDE